MGEKSLLFLVNAALTEILWEGYQLFREKYSIPLRLSVFSTQDVEENSSAARALEASLFSSDMVFLDVRGGGRSLGILHRTLPRTSQPVALLLGGSPETLKLLRLGSFSFEKLLKKSRKPSASKPSSEPNLAVLQKITAIIEKVGSLLPFGQLKHMRNWVRMMTYWNNGGTENVAKLIAFAAKEYLGFGRLSVPGPKVFPDLGICDPLSNETYASTRAYFRNIRFSSLRPTVGILFYGGMHFQQSLIPARAITEELRSRGIQIIPVVAKTGSNLKAIRQFFMHNGTTIVDAVIYLQWFQLTTFTGQSPDDSISVLKNLNVPIITACPMYGGKISSWEKSDRGLTPVEVLTTVVLPELDGMIEPIPTAGLCDDGIHEEMSVKRVRPIPNNIRYLANRVANWISLRRKTNKEKRVAFVIYDNPPGEDNLGSAAYLDTFASIENILQEMKRLGYSVDNLPDDESLCEYLIRRLILNTPRWGDIQGERFGGRKLSAETYRKLCHSVPAQDEVVALWGDPPGSVMATNGDIILPVVEFGNLLIGVQPARGFHEDIDKISHDKTLPPHHQYVAFYRWLEEEWKADCIVHVGTHGTLEFLPGKEVGVSTRCFPPALLGTVPHVYFYHVVNASEATIAKRRSLGVLINYSSPHFTVSGLYEGYQALEDLIEEYIEAQSINPERAERLKNRILEDAKAINLNFDDIPSLQEELLLMKRSIIPKGLHVIGESPGEDASIDFATFFLRYDREHPSLHRILAKARGYDYEKLLSPTKAEDASVSVSRVLEEIESEVRNIVKKAWYEGIYPKDKDGRCAVECAIEIAKKLDSSLEYENFFRALEGGYVEPGLGGDPLRNPETLPTGRNSYQFDPRLVPSPEAMRRGKEIAENTLEHYRLLHGSYPKSVAVILWGFETTKTRGETVAQVLSYLGVRIAPHSNPYHKELQAIPIEELGRPRIDCLVQICGFFRDMYSNVLDMLHRAFQLVSKLDEPPEVNFVRAHTEERRKFLEELDVSPEEREHIAVGRIFGPRAGEYGTRITHLIETGAWKNEEEIASLFYTSMQHLYGGPLHGKPLPEIYKKTLQKVDVVSQVRDTHEYELVDLDHYYEFFGGLSRTVESVRGKAPVMLITDTTKEIIRTESVKESLNRGIRTRLLNPVWINALLEHAFHGAQKIADRVEYLVGFAATTHAVDNWVWSEVVNRYVRDEEMFRRMTENNRFAMEQIIARLLEANDRGYWQATEEELAILKEKYLELEGAIEEAMES